MNSHPTEVFPDLDDQLSHLEHLLKTHLRAESLHISLGTGPRNLFEINLKLIHFGEFESHEGPLHLPVVLCMYKLFLFRQCPKPVCKISVHVILLFKTLPCIGLATLIPGPSEPRSTLLQLPSMTKLCIPNAFLLQAPGQLLSDLGTFSLGPSLPSVTNILTSSLHSALYFICLFTSFPHKTASSIRVEITLV